VGQSDPPRGTAPARVLEVPAVDPLSLLGARENPLEGRIAWAESRMTADGRLPLLNYVRAAYRNRAMLRRARLAARLGQIAPGAFTRAWKALGPADEGGRTQTLVVNPRDPNVMYVGGVAGGVFKSTDAGASWKPVTEAFGNVTVSSLVLDPTNPDVVYAGTGELLASGHQRPTTGIGILKSTTAGASWRLIPSTVGFGPVNDIVVSPNDPLAVYASTERTVLRSSDGGTSWQPSLADGGDTCRDLAIRTDRNPDTVFAACAHNQGGSVWRTVDGGARWDPVITTVEEAPIGNTALAIAPSNQEIVYASVGEVPNELGAHALALVRSDQGGADGTWQVVNTADDTPGHPRYLASCRSRSGQAWYGNAIGVAPNDPEHLWLGGVDLFRSDDGGRTITVAGYWELRQAHALQDGTPYVHADFHAIEFHPNYDGAGNQTVYFGNDGGVFRTTNDRAPLADPNCFPLQESSGDPNRTNDVVYDALNDGFSAIQFYGGAVSDDGRYLLGGAQDNGNWALDTQAGGPNDWFMVQGGDGFEVAISPANDAFYMEYTNGAVTRIPQLVETTGYQQEELYNRLLPLAGQGGGRFHSPILLDPNDPNVLYVGLAQLWRTLDRGATFVPASDQFIGSVSAIAVAPGNGDVIYSGTEFGQVYVTVNGRTQPPAWTDISAGLPSGLVSSIAINPADPRIAYATFATFGVPHVWKTTDQGASWVDVSRDLPDVPANTVAINPVNPEMVYAGTDSGVYESVNGGATWLPASGRLISTIVMDLVFRTGTSELYAFTHGRGAFMVDVGTGG
jgi:photosystem II stability/assembly factor-like uncharacterized protein